MKYFLKKLSLDDGKDILDMLYEIGGGENGFINECSHATWDEFQSFLNTRIDWSRGINLPQGFVPNGAYWLIQESGYPVGYGKLRYSLNSELLHGAGHLGYCIRPSERGKGIARIFLSKLLRELHEKGINRALLTPYESNKKSCHIIESIGGVLEDIENDQKRFWINTSDFSHA